MCLLNIPKVAKTQAILLVGPAVSPQNVIRFEVTHPELEAVFALRSLGADYDWAFRNVSEFKWMKF
jgi:hypothetical protein